MCTHFDCLPNMSDMHIACPYHLSSMTLESLSAVPHQMHTCNQLLGSNAMSAWHMCMIACCLAS